MQMPEAIYELCPTSHPIPCAGGSKCTAKPFPLDPSYCKRSNMLKGTCCPDDAIPCKQSESGHLCKGNPEFGELFFILRPFNIACNLDITFQGTFVPPLTPTHVEEV